LNPLFNDKVLVYISYELNNDLLQKEFKNLSKNKVFSSKLKRNFKRELIENKKNIRK
jgi:hypothetical protein